jgi:hypothetical protein
MGLYKEVGSTPAGSSEEKQTSNEKVQAVAPCERKIALSGIFKKAATLGTSRLGSKPAGYSTEAVTSEKTPEGGGHRPEVPGPAYVSRPPKSNKGGLLNVQLCLSSR